MIGIILSLTPVPPFIHTLETETQPLLSYDCSLATEEFRQVKLTFVTEGGRGYQAPDRTIRVTPTTLRIVRDDSQELSSLTFVGLNEHSRGGRFMSGDKAITLTEVTPYMKSEGPDRWRASLVMTVDYGPSTRRYAGFCMVTSKDQKPFTRAEAKKAGLQ